MDVCIRCKSGAVILKRNKNDESSDKRNDKHYDDENDENDGLDEWK